MSTIEQIKARNHAAGFHFFEPATLRFFKGRVSSHTAEGRDGRTYFVTSEQGPNMPRRYTVRVAHKSGSVDTVGEFNVCASLESAKRSADRVARCDRESLHIGASGYREQLQAMRTALWDGGPQYAYHARYSPSLDMVFVGERVEAVGDANEATRVLHDQDYIPNEHIMAMRDCAERAGEGAE